MPEPALRNGWRTCGVRGLPVLLALVGFAASCPAQEQAAASKERAAIGRFVNLFCVECHNRDDETTDLALDALGAEALNRNPNAWEQVVRKLNARQMPPDGSLRPKERDYQRITSLLTATLDRAAEADPTPGRTETFRRLTRTEYQNAIRDLLALDVDASTLLPADESSRGFDNITVTELSPTLLERYLSAARKISRLAIGRPGRSPGGDTFRVPADVTQEERVEALPLGTRGGTLIRYTFPQDGEYDVQLRLARDRNEQVEGLHSPHELEVLLDRRRMALFTIDPPRTERDHQTVDAHLKARIKATAGPHDLGVTFLKEPSSLLETKRQPYQAHYNTHRHPRISPALFQVSITGPYDPQGHGDTPSRRRVFVCSPTDQQDEDDCARRILATLTRRAYRRPVTDADIEGPMALYRQTHAEEGFEAGIETALSAVLMNPRFLFRIEADPPDLAPKSVYRVSDVALASRLSFFLWSSIPDDELLDLAERGELSKPDVLEAQARRMLADARSGSLATNFAGQWLHLRNLEAITPDLRLFPDFDDNLRQAFRRETELLFESVVREDRSVLDLLKSDSAYLNERLAKHYGIPNVYGSRFRRVEVGNDGVRGGLLRQGSILTATSYATRTSPVLRGKWVLENLIGTPPPPQPPNVPALKDDAISSRLSVRERLAEHRRDIACAGCHKLMDPVGFALENYDAVGRWRSFDDGRPVDAAGGFPDGRTFDGPDGLEEALLNRPELFISTMTEKLLTFALGRGVEPSDAPAVRTIVREARASGYRFSSLIVGITRAAPFQMRSSQ